MFLIYETTFRSSGPTVYARMRDLFGDKAASIRLTAAAAHPPPCTAATEKAAADKRAASVLVLLKLY